MKDRRAGFIRGLFFVVSILSYFQSTGYAECFCGTPDGSGCRRWGSGEAKFIWAGSGDGGSGVTLTAGSCGQGGEGATGYIFSSVDEICNGGNVCNDGYTSAGGCAVIKVSGSQKALMNTVGLFFTSTMVCGYSTQYHPTVGISQTGVEYVLPVELPASRIMVSAVVGGSDEKFSGAKFKIQVKFFDHLTRNGFPDRYVLLTSTSGSVSVKRNKQKNTNIQVFQPNLRGGSSIAGSKGTYQDYSEDPWVLPYQDYECSYQEEDLGPAGRLDDTYLIPAGHTYYKVKYPNWENAVTVNHQPGYITQEGWEFEKNQNRYKYDMGDMGIIYYHCEQMQDDSYRLRTIERCEVGEDPSEGDLQWTFVYDGQDRLLYIHNGTNLSDPNTPNHATKYYEYEWDGNESDVSYYTRDSVGQGWQIQRDWQLEFDEDLRATKYRAGCDSGCGSQSGSFEHVEYAYFSTDEDFEEGNEDYIAKRYNANGILIEDNTYEIVEYGEYESAGWINVVNSGFESENVPAGQYIDLQQAPYGWGGTVDNARIYDSNDAPEGTQFLRLSYNTGTEIYNDPYSAVIKNARYELQMKARETSTNGYGNLELHAKLESSTERLLAVDANSVTLTGEWKTFQGTWDSDGREEDLVDNYVPFRIYLSGSNIEIDDIQLIITKYVGETTKPILVNQKIYDPEISGLRTALERELNQNNNTITEKRYLNATTYRKTVTQYEDETFTNELQTTTYESLFTENGPINPNGDSFTTSYGRSIDPNGLFITTYPNGKRADVQRYGGHGNLIESYTRDLVNDANSLLETYTYEEFQRTFTSENSVHEWLLSSHTNARGGVTQYEYLTYQDDNYLYKYPLLKKRVEPQTSAGSSQTEYKYDNARRVVQERTTDSEGGVTITDYQHNPQTGWLEAVEVTGNQVHAITQYKYNDFGEVIRQTSPDGVVTGKSYGTGGELLSEFVISENSDPNDADAELLVVSQTKYTYTADGQIETISRAKDEEEFEYDSPDSWIVTKYQYDALGRKIKDIEDFGTGRTNLATEYQYNLQGELEKVLYPTGRWIKTIRDGRGLVIEEQVGYSTDSIVLKTFYNYDANGNLIRQINPDGTALVYEYDNYDRLRRTYKHDQNGPYTEKEYDNAGQVIRETAFEANGTMLQDIRREYDVLGNLMKEQVVKDPNYPSQTEDLFTFYNYDIAGNLKTLIQTGVGNPDPNGVIPDPNNDLFTETIYDGLNRRIAIIDPEGIRTSFVYSPGGLVLQIIDPNSNDPNILFLTQNTYDPYSRLEKTINPMGHYTINTYNSLNQITKQLIYDCNETPDDEEDDFAVRQIRTVYDNLGNITRQAVMANPASTAAVQVGIDAVTDSVYDPDSGLLSQVKTYYGTGGTAAITTYDYDGIGRKTETTDPEGNQEILTYYTLLDGNPSQIKKVQRMEKDPVNSNNDYTITTFYTYDPYGRLAAQILDEDGDGQIDNADPNTTYTYDGMDHLTRETVPDGIVTFYAYDGFGNIRLKVDDYGTGTEENRTTEFVYDRLNRQSEVIAYDPNDTTEHVAEQITRYEYDKNGNVTIITYPDGKFTQYVYNILNKVDTEIQRDSREIYYWYDLLGNLVMESDDPDGDQGTPSFYTQFNYDGAGNLIYAYKNEDNADVSESQFTYNGLGLRTSEKATWFDLDPVTTIWTYDGSGNLLTQTHGETTLTYTHDGLGRVKTIDRGEDNIVNYAYLGQNTKAIEYPQPDMTQEFGYDDLGRIIQCRSADVNDVSILDFQYTYNELGNRKSMKYNHLETPVWDKYWYDRLNRLEEVEYGASSGFAFNETTPDQSPWQTLYTDFDLLVNTALAWVNETADYADFTDYISKDSVNPVILSEYLEKIKQTVIQAGFKDVDDFLKSVKSVTPVVYNPQEPIYTLTEFGDDDPNGYRYETCRDEDNNIIAQIIWDNEDRMVLFAIYPDAGGTVVIVIRYDNQGNEIYKVCTTYDEDGTVVEVVDMLAATIETADYADYTNFSILNSSFSIESAMTLDGGDGIAMMSSPEGPTSASEQFDYDHLGNRYQYTDKSGYVSTYDHNPVNQYGFVSTDFGIGGLTYNYTLYHDDNGNLEFDEEGTSYIYDYRNRLTLVEDIESNIVAEYAYDALGRRIRKTIGNKATYFFYDTAGQVIAEYEGESPELTKEYVYGNGYNEILAMFLPYNAGDPNFMDTFSEFCAAWLSESGQQGYSAEFDYDSDGKIDLEDFSYYAGTWDIPTSIETDWYYLTDAFGGVRGLIGGRFNREEDREFYNYDVYGKLSIANPEQSKSGNPYLFAGYRFDAETDLYYTDYRTYESTNGRWLQFDPATYDDAYNLYEYVGSSPAVYIDPYGLRRGGPRPPIDFDPVPPSKPHGPFPGDHTHYRWYDQNRKTGQRFPKMRVKEGCPDLALRIRMAFNNWSTHPVAGPATMGAGAGVATYLGYKNIEVRMRIKIMEGLADIDYANEKAISDFWYRRMQQFGKELLREEVLPYLNTECCNKRMIQECQQKFLNSLSNYAANIGLQYYRLDRQSDERIYGPGNANEMLPYIEGSGWHGPESFQKCVNKACNDN